MLTMAPEWLLGIVVRFKGLQDPVIWCRHCGETLCAIEQGERLWTLADVARDHRKFCRDKDERGLGEPHARASKESR